MEQLKDKEKGKKRKSRKVKHRKYTAHKVLSLGSNSPELEKWKVERKEHRTSINQNTQ